VKLTVYITESDKYLLGLVDRQARRERKSKSAVILSLIEEHYEKSRKLGEILVDLGVLSEATLEDSLRKQRQDSAKRLIGEILTDDEGISTVHIQRALEIQNRWEHQEADIE